ncbi:MAG: hypothetical protein GQ582_08255 [Methyloprofundus sp.]|nr:hypothetical protein [Methyloprofundus sp.]
MNQVNIKPTKTTAFITKTFESILVIGYLLFEELFWNFIAEPVYDYIKSLIALEPLKKTFLEMNRYALLVVFLFNLSASELMGILAGLHFVEGELLMAASVYTLKIPIVIFTFWLFELTKNQLLSFNWLKHSYEWAVHFIHKIRSSSLHVYIKAKVEGIKQKAKPIIDRYFGEAGLLASIKVHYGIFKPYMMNWVRFFK